MGCTYLDLHECFHAGSWHASWSGVGNLMGLSGICSMGQTSNHLIKKPHFFTKLTKYKKNVFTSSNHNWAPNSTVSNSLQLDWSKATQRIIKDQKWKRKNQGHFELFSKTQLRPLTRKKGVAFFSIIYLIIYKKTDVKAILIVKRVAK